MERLGLILMVLGSAAAVRAYLLPFPSNFDVLLLQTFAERLADIGPRDYYLADYDHYLPGYLYVLWAIGELHQTLLPNISDSTYYIILKLPANFFDFATAGLIFMILKKRASDLLAVLGAAVYLFNPAVLYLSAVWGQFEAVQTFFCLAAIYLLLEQNKPELATVSMSLAVLVKAQAIGLVPIFALALLLRTSLKRMVSSVAIALVMAFLIQLPFFLGDPFFGMISLTQETLDNYPFTSLNAFNLWWILGAFPNNDQATFLVLNKQQWGTALWLAAQLAIGFWLLRNRREDAAVYWAGSLALFAFFVLPTRIHERYLFPFFSFFTIGALLSRYRIPLLVLYGCLSVLHFLNLYYVQQPEPYPVFAEFFDFSLSHKTVIAYLFVGSFGALLAATLVHASPLQTVKSKVDETASLVARQIRHPQT